MKHIAKILTVIVLAMSLGACEKVIEVDAGERQLVLNGVPSEGKRAFVNFSYTHFFLDTLNPQPVSGVNMTLKVNGVPYRPDSVGGCNYFFPYTLQADDQLEINVDADGHHLEASTYIPRPPQINNMAVKYYESPSFNFYLASFKLADHADYSDYYSIKIEVRDSGARYNEWTAQIDTVDTVGSTYFIVRRQDITAADVCPFIPLGGYLYSQLMFLDKHIDGETIPVDLFIIKLVDTNEIAPFKHWYTVSAETVTPHRWNYLLSVARSSSMTSYFTEQGEPETNITIDGEKGLGIFAGNARYKYLFDPDTISDTIHLSLGKSFLNLKIPLSAQ